MRLINQWVSVALLFCSATLTAGELQLAADQVKAQHRAKVEATAGGFFLKSNTAEWDAGAKITPPTGKLFDFSTGKFLAVDVENLSKTRQMRLTMHITSGGKDKVSTSHVDLPLREVNTGIGLNPGEKRTMRIYLPHANLFTAPEGGMNLRRPLDTARINSIDLKMQWPFEPHDLPGLVNCRVTNLRLEGETETAKKVNDMGEKYFPFFDAYGQYKHGEWPEKIHSDADLKKEHARELAAIAANPAPANWNHFGGWTDGPLLEATGNFRTEKHNGKWFLVDPEGRLFWSIGIDVLRNQTDAINGKGREKWFSQPIAANGTVPFNDWNLQKKYGKEDYKTEFYETLTKRLRSWGINTIGAWGASDLMELEKTPYTLVLGELLKGFPRLPGVKFYDVFDPDFEVMMGNVLRDRAEEDELVRLSIDDPMCIGYFIDNELSFNSIMGGVIQAGAEQPAKQEFIKDLKAKYSKIGELNKSWGSNFASWDALAANKETPKGNGFRPDADLFRAKFVDRYFEICAKGIKSAAPHRLYLGCRLVGFRQPEDIRRSAAKYCDVISINTYHNSVANVPSRDFFDKPILIGEFHFGTYDRGMFSASLCPVGDQQERATSFTRYVQGALVHPNMVGAHWFQFRDQPLTGRWDGEGYQIGFVDVADTPYPEMTEAARKIGENMYSYRLKGKLVNPMSEDSVK